MDYSKHGIEKKKYNLRSSAKRARKKAGFTIFRIFIVCFILVSVVGVSAGIGGFRGIIDSSPQLNLSDIAPKGFKSYIYSKDGELEHEIIGANSNRIYVSIDEINDNVQNAFIALEDKRFRSHNGIDPEGIVRAFFVGLANGGDFTEGASTITQQLLKLSVFSGGAETNQLLRFRRKFQEQYLALELEKQLSKDEILEAYLNTINLGKSCYGVEAASNYYFNKSASELDVSEAAILASIAQSPTNNNPVDNPEKNNERRKTTINYMHNQGLIDEATRDNALADTGIYDEILVNAQNYVAEQAEPYTYYQEEAIKQVIEDLQTKLGYTKEEAENKVYSGAINIYLAQDKEIQQICEEIYADDSNFPMTEYLLDYALSVYVNPDDPTDDTTNNFTDDDIIKASGLKYPLYASREEAEAAVEEFKTNVIGITENTKYTENITITPQIQSSFVMIDQSNGYVTALMAGRGEKTVNFGFNRATSATRQPGSVFKIVSTYAPALDACGDTLASSKLDKNIEYANGHVIRNVDKYESNTNITFREAILKSKNTVAVRTLQEDVGTDLALKYLTENFHFSTMDRSRDAVDVLAIGGITNGVTNLELTAAFASIANLGQYNRPVFYTKVLDSDGTILLENSPDNPESTTALKPTTAYQLTDAMVDVVTKPGGTAYGNVYVPNMTIAGKTGTTDDWKDTWFVGYSPYYTAGIWFGYDNNLSPATRYGWRLYTHEVLWAKIINRVNEVKGYERKDFTMPDGLKEVTVCIRTGNLPGANCQTRTELMETASVPIEVCTQCNPVAVCGVCNGLAGENSTEITYIYEESALPNYYCTCLPQPEEPEEGDGTTPPEGGTTVTPDPNTATPAQ